MSVYAYFCCHECRQKLWLGKSLHAKYIPFAFHIGDSSEPRHWRRPELNKILWKFLADHAKHKIEVLLEHDMTEETYGYAAIGGDCEHDISVRQYLRHPSGFYEDQ